MRLGPPHKRTRTIYRDSHLSSTFWIGRIAVIALENPPWTDLVHVFLQKLPFQGFRTVLIRAWHNMMGAIFQVCLQEQTIGKKLVTL